MDCAGRLLTPSVPDLYQAVLSSRGDQVWKVRIAADPAYQPSVGWRVGMGQFQLGTPNAEPEILTNCGSSEGFVGTLPDVKSGKLVLVLRHRSLSTFDDEISRVITHRRHLSFKIMSESVAIPLLGEVHKNKCSTVLPDNHVVLANESRHEHVGN